ncbi:MAG: hydroxyacid dehydrogenase [Alphaproteobacteria bacterium]|nr:hydroxyacid dehydrogenase [Alphaproteobacteria bacterium]
MARIVLTHTRLDRKDKYGDAAVAGLNALGSLAVHDGDEPLSVDGLIHLARDADVIVLDRMVPGEARLFSALPGLVAVHRAAMDIRNIDIPAASAAGVLVTRAGPGFIPAVTELILGQMVDLARGMSRHVAEYRAGIVPPQRPSMQLAGRTAGIAGFGNLGRRMAEILAFMGMRVLVSDPEANIPSAYERADLDRLAAESDFLLCLVIHSPKTEKLMNAQVFRRMKPTAFFLNHSRGGLVDEDDLKRALDEDWIAGAALDVGRAPPDDTPPLALGRHPKVLATPHVGGMVPDSVASQAADTVEQVASVLAGKIPKYAVNPDAATRLAQRRPPMP